MFALIFIRLYVEACCRELYRPVFEAKANRAYRIARLEQECSRRFLEAKAQRQREDDGWWREQLRVARGGDRVRAEKLRRNDAWIGRDVDHVRDATTVGDTVLVPDTADHLERKAAEMLASPFESFDARKFSSAGEATREWVADRFGGEVAQVGETLAWVAEDEAIHDSAMVDWLSRDEQLIGEPDTDRRGGSSDAISTQRRRSSEKAWLDSVLGQLRLNWKRNAPHAPDSQGRCDCRRCSERRGLALKARYNTRRYLEAFGQDEQAEPIREWLKQVGWRNAEAKLAARAKREYVTATELL